MEAWLWIGLGTSLFLAWRASMRFKELEQAHKIQLDQLDRLSRRVGALARQLEQRGDPLVDQTVPAVSELAVAALHATPEAARVAGPTEAKPPEPSPQVAPASAAGPVSAPAVAAAPTSATPTPPVETQLFTEKAPATPEIPEAPATSAPSPAYAWEIEGEHRPEPPAPQKTKVAPTPPRPPKPPPPPKKPFDWENLIGVRLFSWVAGIAILVAGFSFLKYSIDVGWLGPPVRMAIGLTVGVALLVGCELWGRRYPVTANALDAAGIGLLFSTVFAANALWHLIPSVPTFAFMALITALAVLLSLHHDSIFVALLGLVGGFATPILLSTGQDQPIGLFTYLLLLNLGLAWVAYRKRWPLLTAASLVFTALYQWGWLLRFVTTTPKELPLAAAIFFVFPLFAAVANFIGRGGNAAKDGPQAGGPVDLFDQTALVAALLPLLFPICLAWVPSFQAAPWLLFGFLFLVDAGLAVLAVLKGPGLLHAASGLTTLLVFAGWLSRSYSSEEAWPTVLWFVSLFVLFYLFAPRVARWLRRPFDGLAARGSLTAPLLFFTFPALAALEPRTANPMLLFGTLLVLALASGAVAVLDENGPLHFVAAFFAVAAEAVWSAKHLTPERLPVGLALYALFGLFYLGVPVIARRLGKRLLPEGSGAALLLCSLAMLLFLAAGDVAHTALWGMGLLLALLNLGLFFEARTSRLPFLALAGMILSWVVIGVWWATAMVVALLLPALVIVAGFALLIVAGNLWAGRAGSTEKPSSAFQQGVYLGLVGHLFLLFVASRSGLAVPPWSLLGILFLLDLAILAASLFGRRAELNAAALGVSQLILLMWLFTARGLPSPGLPWTEVALIATCAIAAMALLALPLARRRKAESPYFLYGAAAALYAAQFVALVASAVPEAPGVGWLAAVQTLLVLALLGLARQTDRQELGLAAVVLPAVGLLLWEGLHFQAASWTQELLFAAGPYALFSLYPLTLGEKAKSQRLPFLGAILGAVPFFWAGRHAMIAGGQAAVIGILPVGQAVVLLLLLLYVLRLEPEGARDRGRLALVAGASLAFITVAIPLQLDKQWITIGWALEAAALAWLYVKLDHRGLLACSLGLAAAVVARLSLNPAILAYHTRGDMRIWNWYLYSYLISALALYVAAWLLAHTDDQPWPQLPRASSLIASGGTLLLFLLLNIEIADWYSTGQEITFNFSAEISQDLTYTLGWAAFAVSLLAAGVIQRGKAARLAALGLLVVTILKCFLHDLWRLGGLYKTVSFVGLAICLALVAVVLQKFVLAPAEERP